ncbi:MAG: Toprim subdomain protein [Candidatus Methanomethylophilaceae archaeon]|nr:Toprim subdomain protein [Candidatus Methanomethylophilaceae archaeon]NLF34276.1 Toprim subdomain protein [Thermoplasmatales archaeon]
MNDEERLERLNEALEELEELAKDHVILLEGRKDLRAIRRLGIGGDTIAVQAAGGPVRAAESVAAMRGKAVILTDWDDRGRRLADQLADQLSALCLEYDSTIRSKLEFLCRKDVKDVEGIPSLHRRLVEACECER